MFPLLAVGLLLLVTSQSAGEDTFRFPQAGHGRSLPMDSAVRHYNQIKSHESSPADQTNPLRIILLSGIRLYQALFSPQYGAQCQFRPTCSHFGAQSIKKQGSVAGLLMTSDRLLRCHPWAEGMYPIAEDGVHYEDSTGVHALWNMK